MKRVLLSCFAVLILGIAAFGQQLGTAILNGDISDVTGAAISGAQVTATNLATGVQRTTTTGTTGLFVVNDLAPGEYEVRIMAPTFGATTARVRLQVGQQANLTLHLQPQQAHAEVSVSDAAPLVNTVSSVVDGIVSQNQIDALPLNGRNFLELSLLLPGNTPAPNFDPTKANTVLISSAGQLGRGANVSIDGADDNDDVVGGMLLNVPEDAVQEFQSATNRFSAELGRSGSSVINVVTKSGSNELHGSASFYERDKALQALPATFDPTSVPGETPPFSRQQYSATLGGPVVKNKAWWFTAFEFRNELGGVLVGTRDVATQRIPMSFAPQPLTDGLGTARGDWQISPNDVLSLHFNIERQDATGGASFLSGAPIGSADERQDSSNNFQSVRASWSHILGPKMLSRAAFSYNDFLNVTNPLTPGPELDFPSIAGGASYRVPQQTHQRRLQWDEGIDWTRGKHNLHFGGQFQRVGADFLLGVFKSGAVEFIQNFPNFDHNGDGVINDQDLLFAVAIRSGNPTQNLIIPDADNNYISGYAEDDWHIHPQLTLNLGARYELDTDVNSVGHYSQINPILLPFLHGTRHKDTNNIGPRVGFNWATKNSRFSVHGGYGIYYDRITLEVESLERGLDGRALPINVSLGNVNYLDNTGHFAPGAPTVANPFTGFVIPGAGGAAEGMNVISNGIQNPMVQQFNLGVEYQLANDWVLRANGIHDFGTHFLIGVPVGTVFNPASSGPETVTELMSVANNHYDALWLTVDKRFAHRYQFHSAYTLSKTLNEANYDQIPFGYPPVDPTNLRREYGPAPNDQRHRLVMQATVDLPLGVQFSPIWTYGSGVPMDILYVDQNGNKSRVPQLARNAGGRSIQTGAQLNGIIAHINAAGGESGGIMLPSVSPNARFNDTFNSFDLRLSKVFRLSERFRVQAIGEAFNLFNITNVLGVNSADYSGYFNVLVADNMNPNYSSKFGTPVSTAGGIFGSGGARAFQLAAKLTF